MSKVRLYISGNEVDFGDGESLLLFTYAAGELDAPAVVQNSYSKEITLPSTERNAQVFGALWRADKVAGRADAFDALAREPFEIRNNAGELLESGYVKMASASKTEGYRLNLFGGLGAFLYGLMYGADGEKKNLASLTWGDAIDQSMTDTITAPLVRSAWDWLSNDADGTIRSRWDVVNFAPMHNGLPSDFDCNKGFVPVGSAHGCPDVAGEQGAHIDGDDYALVTFGKEFDEWEVRDLRSYLQRPVFSLRALLYALENPANNGGYSFDWSDLTYEDFTSTWVSLPMLNTNGITQKSTPLTLTWAAASATEAQILRGFAFGLTPAETLNANSKVTISLGVRWDIAHTGSNKPLSLGNGDEYLHIFARLIGYDSDNLPVAYGPVRCLCDFRSFGAGAAKYLASVTGTTADGLLQSSVFGVIDTKAIEVQEQETLTASSTNIARTDTMLLTLSGYGITHFALVLEGVYCKKRIEWTRPVWDWGGTLKLIAPRGSNSPDIVYAVRSQQYADATEEAATRVRTGSLITKESILGGTASPAEVLLSFVKVFGLIMEYDQNAKRVTLRHRGGFYKGEEVDINERIDRERAYVVEPNGITEKWLDFSMGAPVGAFAEQYRNTYGREYGSQRVNTGSPFNSGILPVLEGISFVQGVTSLAYSRYYWLVRDSSVGTGLLPSPYLDNNCKYTLWKSNGETSGHDVKSLTSAATLTTINAVDEMSAPGYDGFYRLQLANADNGSAGDGTGVLLFLGGFPSEYCHLSDDSAGMLNKNNGVPCWMPCLDTTKTPVPAFVTYAFARAWGGAVSYALDMGLPQALDMPNMEYEASDTIYYKRWRRYIADRYNENAHRVTCYVDWGGMRIEQAMLGKFYWFDGCWWVLDKIEDYCWDNPQPCKCTFVRVLDKTAYTNGQS